VGGEYGTTATYMSEVALKGQRGFYSSFQYVTLIGGQLLAVLLIVILEAVLTDWTIPSGGLYIVTPPGGPRPARITVLAEFFAKHLSTANWCTRNVAQEKIAPK
jgi:MFS family permease